MDELEEEVRELQVQSHDMIEEERKRSREIIQRVEREKQLEIENYAIKWVKKLFKKVKLSSTWAYS